MRIRGKLLALRLISYAQQEVDCCQRAQTNISLVDLAYYQHFLFFLFEDIAFWEVRVATTNAGHVALRTLSTLN